MDGWILMGLRAWSRWKNRMQRIWADCREVGGDETKRKQQKEQKKKRRKVAKRWRLDGEKKRSAAGWGRQKSLSSLWSWRLGIKLLQDILPLPNCVHITRWNQMPEKETCLHLHPPVTPLLAPSVTPILCRQFSGSLFHSAAPAPQMVKSSRQ